LIPDKLDQKILKHLLVDARQSSRQLALKLGISTVTIISRLKKLQAEKIIKGYTAILDHEKLGFNLTAVIEVVARKDKIIEIENELAGIDNICAVYDVTGTTDTFIVAKFKGRDDLSEFVKKISSKPNVENTITHVVLNTIKEDFRLF